MLHGLGNWAIGGLYGKYRAEVFRWMVKRGVRDNFCAWSGRRIGPFQSTSDIQYNPQSGHLRASGVILYSILSTLSICLASFQPRIVVFWQIRTDNITTSGMSTGTGSS